MIRVVIDANQFVSALLKPDSNPAWVLGLAREGKIQLIMSAAIIDEIRAVLLYPKIMKRHRRSPAQLELFLKKLLRVAVITRDEPTLDVIVNDPFDNKYLECAVAGRADFIISGDSHLTGLGLFQGIRILSPTHFRETFSG
ncbi:MAG: putative toxin-antitoxin system toxin component, PIN family [Nitrospirota bacterium]|nr:putative toxin-antitoxin system toxin component, PIN family [Nitrospirota bacterium]